jgi:hypothetical protein
VQENYNLTIFYTHAIILHVKFADVAERQTHTTQNRAGNHVGSNPTIGTKELLYHLDLRLCDIVFFIGWVLIFKALVSSSKD